jgi:ArsR family transcriptional regulator
MDALLAALKAAAEPTRLRILALLSRGELAIGEIAGILNQSQPRVSRHMKLLFEAGLVERLPEGAWVFHKLASGPLGRALVTELLSRLAPGDIVVSRDLERLAAVESARVAAAEAYFSRYAADWNRIRALHAPEAEVERAMLEAAGKGPFDFMVDIGSGQGRMLQLFAPRVLRAEGIDPNHQMLTIARAALAEIGDGRIGVRQGDVFDLPYGPGEADLVTIHQVLHFLSDPAGAVAAACALVAPGGRIVIADFAPHGLEFLREAHAHRRLGFAAHEVSGWLEAAGLVEVSVVDLPAASASGDPASEPPTDRLAVTVWSARRPAAVLPARRPSQKAA